MPMFMANLMQNRQYQGIVFIGFYWPKSNLSWQKPVEIQGNDIKLKFVPLLFC